LDWNTSAQKTIRETRTRRGSPKGSNSNDARGYKSRVHKKEQDSGARDQKTRAALDQHRVRSTKWTTPIG
jgi:hypothetical protein